jgi:hypothetical protein
LWKIECLIVEYEYDSYDGKRNGVKNSNEFNVYLDSNEAMKEFLNRNTSLIKHYTNDKGKRLPKIEFIKGCDYKNHRELTNQSWLENFDYKEL